MTMAPVPGPGANQSHWDPQIIGLVGLICSIFLLFSYYQLLKRNCANFRVINLSRNRNQRRRINEHIEEFSSQFQSRALDSFIMHSLPITQIKKTKGEEELHSTECAVCLGEYEDDDWVKCLPICSHVFHVSCIDTWFQTHSSCPLCRSLVYGVSTTNECAISMHSFLETLDREDFRRTRSEHYEFSPPRVVESESRTY